jgi:hypothetical protein
MKKITLLFIFFCFSWLRANQRDNLSSGYIKSTANQTRGVGQNLPLMDKQICMSFKFTDEFSNVEYQETVQTKTDLLMVEPNNWFRAANRWVCFLF